MNHVINPDRSKLSSWKPQNKLATLLAALACVLMAQAVIRLGAFAIEKTVPTPLSSIESTQVCTPEIEAANLYRP